MTHNPFAALGLPARPDLTDEQVRAAWRAIAAATHPDRRTAGTPPGTPSIRRLRGARAPRGDAPRPGPTSPPPRPAIIAFRHRVRPPPPPPSA